MTATVELLAADDKKLTFAVEAHGGMDVIARGRQERFVVDRVKFDAKMKAKRAARIP